MVESFAAHSRFLFRTVLLQQGGSCVWSVRSQADHQSSSVGSVVFAYIAYTPVRRLRLQPKPSNISAGQRTSPTLPLSARPGAESPHSNAGYAKFIRRGMSAQTRRFPRRGNTVPAAVRRPVLLHAGGEQRARRCGNPSRDETIPPAGLRRFQSSVAPSSC